MKRKGYCIFFCGIVLLILASCGKKIVPASAIGKAGKGYDVAKFNYVYVEAIKQKLMGNSGDALNYLEQCVKINPQSDASYYQMSQIVIAGGDTGNGKKYALKAHSIDEQNIWYIMMLAGIQYQEKNIDSAIIYYEKAVKVLPDKESLQLTLGNLYAENKNFEKANAIFNALDEKYGVNESSTLSSVKNLISDKKFDEALVKTQRLISEYPNEILYNGLLAEIYRGKGDNSNAKLVYKQLLDQNPDNPQAQLSFCDFLLSEKSFEELFVFLNTVSLNTKVLREEKISLFARIIENHGIDKEYGDRFLLNLLVLEAAYKDDEIIPLLRPDFLIKLNKTGEAAIRLEEIIKKYPDNYYAWEKLLLIYLQLNDYEKLLTKGEECATRFNTSFLVKLLYANGAIENDKYALALEELRKAEILAGDKKELIIQVLTMKADVYYRMKNFTEAFNIFEEALKADNEDVTVINNYAYYLAEQNMRLKDAEEMAKRVIDKEKNNTTYLDTYGWVLYKRGKLNEAARVMESVINSGEKPDAEWFEHYGYILKAQKKCTEAVNNWNIALELDSTKSGLIKEIESCKK